MRRIHVYTTLVATGTFLLVQNAFAQNPELTASMSGSVTQGTYVQTGVNANINTNNSSTTKAGTSRTIQATTSMETNVVGASIKGEGSASVMIEINGDTERANTSAPELANPAEVRTEADFHAYARGLVRKNVTIETITTDNTRVSYTHTIPAKFLGLIPFTISETVNVMSSGDGQAFVTVDRSWISILSSTNVSVDDETKTIQTRLEAVPSSQFTLNLTPIAKALILSQVDIAAQASVASSVSY